MPKRSESNKKEDISRSEFDSKTVHRWITEDIDEDYGIDLMVTETKQEDSQILEKPFFVQVKSTDELNNALGFPLDVENLKLWMKQDIPVLLAVYSFEDERFYWKGIQRFVWEELENDFDNWKEAQGSYTVNLNPNKSLQDLESIEEEMAYLRSKIVKKRYLSTETFEGVNITDDAELEEQEAKALSDFKKTALMRGGDYLSSAEREEAAKKFKRVYESPENDEAKLRSIIGLMSTQNPMNQEELKKRIEYAKEGSEISQKLEKEKFSDFFKIEEHLGLFLAYSDIMAGAYMTKKVQDENESPLSFLVNTEAETRILDLKQKKEKSIKEVNNRLDSLVDEGEESLIITSISNIIEFLAVETSRTITAAIENKEEFIQNELEKPNIVKSAEELLKNTEDDEIKLSLLGSLSFYNYYVLETEEAEKQAKKQLEIAKKSDNKSNIKQANVQLERIKEKPNPYSVEEPPSEAEMSTEEYKEMLRKMLKAQNLIEPKDEDMRKAIDLGLEDADPAKYFRKCKNIRISYIGTSPMGQSIGLPTLGSKIIMCKHSGQILQGSSLESMFQQIKEHCDRCDECESRSKDWECTVEWVQEQEEDEELQKVVERIRNNQG